MGILIYEYMKKKLNDSINYFNSVIKKHKF